MLGGKNPDCLFALLHSWRRPVSAVCLVALMLSLLPGCDFLPNRREMFFNRGESAFNEGDYPEAVASFTKYLAFQRNALGLYARGLAYKSMGNRDAALRDFNEALDINQYFSDARSAKAWLFYVDFDFATAMVEYHQAYLDYTSEVENLSFAAWSALGAGYNEKAVEWAKQAIQEEHWRGAEPLFDTIVAYMALNNMGEGKKANEMLRRGLLMGDSSKWPYPALEYLNEQISENQLLLAARNRGETTEARAYLVFKALLDGNQEAAERNTKLLLEEGDNRYFEYHIIKAVDNEKLDFHRAEDLSDTAQPVKSIHMKP